MIDPAFNFQVPQLDGRFGTENVGPLLYSLIRLTRPRRLLEVGTGYSTLCILQALHDNVESDARERTAGTNIFGKTGYYKQEYKPMLIALDDKSHQYAVADEVSEAINQLGLGHYLSLINTDFRGYSLRMSTDQLPLDFLWFDCGGLQEYIDFTREYWNLCNPDGGLILFHSTQSNFDLRLFMERLEELQVDHNHDTFELLSLLEPHKKRQNSISILRRTAELRRPIYTDRP